MGKIALIFLTVLCVYAKDVRVAVAANVGYVFEDLTKAFNEQYPKIKIIPTLASSGSLSAQIINNAPYDIFMSADMSYPEKLYKLHLAKSKPKRYAKGLLVLVSKQKPPKNGFYFLQNSSIQTIAIANPKTAPYGKATIEVLKHAKLHEKIRHKFVYAQSVSQTLAFVLSGTDVGFVAKSSLYAKTFAKYKDKIFWQDIEPNLYSSIEQGAIELEKSSKSAKYFYNFLFSKRAEDIFKKYGYSID